MFAANKSSQILVRYAIKNARNMSAISGPPMQKISGAEKLIHGSLIAGGIMAIPLWVLVNIKKWRAASQA